MNSESFDLKTNALHKNSVLTSFSGYCSPVNPFPNLSSFCSAPLLDMNYQYLFWRSQPINALPHKAIQPQSQTWPHQNIKQALYSQVGESLGSESSIAFSLPSKSEITYSSSPVSVESLKCLDLRLELETMLDFILFNMGKDNLSVIQNARNHYLKNPILVQVYDKLFTKYYSATKCKEDMIRYIFRKVLKGLRTSIMKEKSVSGAKASLLLYQRYFQGNTEQQGDTKEIVKDGDRDEIYEFFLCFKNPSKAKNMNLKFVLKLFSYPEFCQAYQDYLPELNKIIIQENDERKRKFIKTLVVCAEKNTISKIGAQTRLPWLDVWMNDTKNIAVGMMPNKRLIYVPRKSKF